MPTVTFYLIGDSLCVTTSLFLILLSFTENNYFFFQWTRCSSVLASTWLRTQATGLSSPPRASHGASPCCCSTRSPSWTRGTRSRVTWPKPRSEIRHVSQTESAALAHVYSECHRVVIIIIENCDVSNQKIKCVSPLALGRLTTLL